ncbi:hypothetical protein ACTFIZ_006233 [Dictyostelium cf. discoideum]
MSLTGNESINKLIYSYIGIRLLSYLFFFILNCFQTIMEGKLMIEKKNKIATRFFIFFSLSSFCGFRIISTCMFYWRPNDFQVGTIHFIFFSLGTASVFSQWVFILHFWLLIMYSFFVSEDVRINRLKPINYSTALIIFALLVYIIFMCVGGMLMDLKFGQAVGFLSLLVIYSIMVIGFGSALLNNLQKHKKNTPFQHYKDMIFKTKILLITLILTFSLTFIEEFLFQFKYELTFQNKLLSNFLTMCIDTSQMIVVMFVLANGKFRNYILFRHVKTTSFNSDKSNSFDSMWSKYNRRKSLFPSNLELSGGMSLSMDTSIEMDNVTFSINSNNIDNSNTQNESSNSKNVLTSPSIYDIASLYGDNLGENETETSTAIILNLTNQNEDNNL